MKRRKDGRYQEQVHCGYDEFGKRKRKTIYGKTQKELNKNVIEFKNQLENNPMMALKPITFKQMGDIWFEKYTSDLTPSTIQRYKSVFKNQLEPIHDMKLNNINTGTIQVLLNTISQKGYSSTVKLSKVVLKLIFKKAVICNYIQTNPVQEANLPKYNVRKRRALTHEELEAIANTTEFSAKEKAYIYIGLYAGLRQGEILALKTSDIDIEHSSISVKKTLTYSTNKPTVKNGTKTKSGERIIYITEPLISVLKEYLQYIQEDSFLFLQKDGCLYSKTGKRNLWKQILKKINKNMVNSTTDITSHYLRHNYATELYRAGVKVKEAQYLLGHSNIQTTLNIYTELDKQNIDISCLSKYWINRK